MKNKIVTCIVLTAIAFLICMAGAFAQYKSTFAGDINIDPFTNGVYNNARVSVAYNGDIYVGRLLNTTTSDNKVWEVQRSVDGGYTFTQFAMNFILQSDIKYTTFDIVACGNNDAEFRLYVARASLNTTTGDAVVGLSSYNSSGTLATVPLTEASYTSSNATRGYQSLSLTTDSKMPSLDASPYSISLAVQKSGINDSIVLWTDMTGGSTMNRRSLHGTPTYIRNVSAATGSAQGSVYGRLGVAWDEFDSSVAEWGNIKVQFVYTDDGQDANFSGPYDIGSQPNLHRKPTFAMSNNNNQQDITGSIIFEYDASSTNEGSNIYSRTFGQLITGTPELESVTVQIGNGDQKDPHVCYNSEDNEFLYTYYNAANDALVYETADLSTDIQNLPTTTKQNYRDDQSVIANAMPRVDGRSAHRNFFVWNDNGLTYLDAELNWPASVQNTSVSVSDIKLFPNPATDNINISFTSENNDKATISIIDMSGRTIQYTEAQITKGSNKLPIALNNLPTGNYTIRLSGEHTNTAVMFTVQH